MTDTIKVGLYTINSIVNYDPARINDSVEANVIRALYSRLVEVDPNSQIPKPSIATYEVIGKKIIFTLRDTYTSKNIKITPDDVYYSFMRLLVLQTSTHGNLQLFLCSQNVIKSIHDRCPGLEVVDNKVILTTTNEWFPQILLPLLMSVDFSILPYSAINWDDPKYPIIDYTNTSGRYFVKKDDPKGEWLLESNKHHIDHNDLQPEKIKIYNTWGPETTQAFDSKKIDLITTTDYAGLDFLTRKPNSDIEVFSTEKICLFYLKFTEQGLKKFNTSERFFIANEVKAKIKDISFFQQTTPSYGLYPELGELALNEESTNIVKAKFRTSARPQAKKAILSVGKFYLRQYKDAFSTSKYIDVALYDERATLSPDLEIVSTDSSFFESFSLFSYSLQSMGVLKKNHDRDAFMVRYLEETDKTNRLSLLRNYHLSILLSGTVFPLGLAPYVAVVRKPWHLQFSAYAAGSPLWSIIKN